MCHLHGYIWMPRSLDGLRCALRCCRYHRVALPVCRLRLYSWFTLIVVLITLFLLLLLWLIFGMVLLLFVVFCYLLLLMILFCVDVNWSTVVIDGYWCYLIIVIVPYLFWLLTLSWWWWYVIHLHYCCVIWYTFMMKCVVLLIVNYCYTHYIVSDDYYDVITLEVIQRPYLLLFGDVLWYCWTLIMIHCYCWPVDCYWWLMPVMTSGGLPHYAIYDLTHHPVTLLVLLLLLPVNPGAVVVVTVITGITLIAI